MKSLLKQKHKEAFKKSNLLKINCNACLTLPRMTFYKICPIVLFLSVLKIFAIKNAFDIYFINFLKAFLKLQKTEQSSNELKKSLHLCLRQHSPLLKSHPLIFLSNDKLTKLFVLILNNKQLL